MVQRRVVFYKWRNIPSKEAFNPEVAWTALRRRIEDEPEYAVLQGSEGATAAQSVDNANLGSRAVYFQLFALRGEDQHPMRFEPGKPLSRLPLGVGEYTADVSHVAVWPDGIAAHDYARNMPRPTRLSYFLREKLGSYVSFEPLYQPDMVERLRAMRGQLRGFSLGLTNQDYSPANASTMSTLLPALFGSRAPSVKVTLGMGRHGPRNRYLDGAIEDAVLEIAENQYDAIDSLVVRGVNPATGKVDTVNLLSERLQRQVQLESDTSIPSMPSAESAFQELEESYRSFSASGDLRRAALGELRSG
jgi:hypothetical protein